MISKQRLNNRILSLVLALVMVLSMLPVTSLTAFAAEDHTHPVCGAAHTDVGDHTGTCSDITWKEWNDVTAMPTEAGAYYLADNVTLSDTWEIPAGVTISLCLNGYSVSGNNAVRVISITKNAALNLCDCSSSQAGTITGGNAQSASGGGVYISKGSFKMYGGSISNNRAYSGGGIHNVNSGTVYMYAGTIRENTCTKHGGGVSTSGAFHMHGGMISENVSVDSLVDDVYVNAGSFVMSGGEISDNSAESDRSIYVTPFSTFRISGKPVIKDAVYLVSSEHGTAYITVCGVLDDEVKIPATNRGIGELLAKGTDTYLLADTDIAKFTSADGQVILDRMNNRLVICDDAHPVYEDGACKTCGAECVHSFVYEANENVITETCNANSNCGHNATAALIVDPNASAIYSGSEIKPLKVEYSDDWFGGELAVSYTNNTNAGTNASASGSVTISGVTYTVTKTFEIKAADIGGAAVTLNPESGSYTGSAYSPSVTVTLTGFGTLAGDTDFTVSWDKTDFTNAGTYTATIEGKGNFTGRVTKAFTVNAATLTDITVEQVGTLIYSGEAQTPVVSASAFAVNGQTVTFTYSIDRENPGSYKADLPDFTNAGKYTVYYKASAPNHSDYYSSFTVTVDKAVLTADDFNFKGPANLVYHPANFKSATITPKDGVIGIDEDDITIQYIKDGQTINYPVNAGTYTVKINVAESANYLAAEGLTADGWTFTITKGTQEVSWPITGDAETVYGKNDGEITGVYEDMEYRKASETDAEYKPITGEKITGLAAGTYDVRLKETDNLLASAPVTVTIAAGRMLTITVPSAAEQIGYTIEAEDSCAYGATVEIKITALEGYGRDENFDVYNNGGLVSNQYNAATGILTLENVTEDVSITLASGSFVDRTKPTAEITVGTNKWNTFWNDLTFNLFFKETQTVTITAEDKGSGLDKVYYYISESELERIDVNQITAWQEYTGAFHIDPDCVAVIYVKAVDKTGNFWLVNSDGLVLDATAPTLEGIENGKSYYGDLTVIIPADQFGDIENVTLDGETMNFMDGTYGRIPADNKEHTVVATDKAGNKTEYKITVYKNYTVTYKIDGETVSTQTVGYGKDATAPTIPEKEGYTAKWDHDGKSITADTEISAVYTEIPKTDIPHTGDDTPMWLWIALLLLSGGAIITLIVYDRKKRTVNSK